MEKPSTSSRQVNHATRVLEINRVMLGSLASLLFAAVFTSAPGALRSTAIIYFFPSRPARVGGGGHFFPNRRLVGPVVLFVVFLFPPAVRRPLSGKLVSASLPPSFFSLKAVGFRWRWLVAGYDSDKHRSGLTLTLAREEERGEEVGVDQERPLPPPASFFLFFSLSLAQLFFPFLSEASSHFPSSEAFAPIIFIFRAPPHSGRCW